MIPNILIVLGVIAIIWALWGIIRILITPYTKLTGIVFKRRDDFLKYETESGKRYYKKYWFQLLGVYISAMLIGSAFIGLGFYFGYVEKGNKFWLYKKVFNQSNENHWDKISSDGKYIAEDGSEYSYYILISGDNYIVNSDESLNDEGIENYINNIRRENTVVLIDSFAVASKYHKVENLLKDKAIKYIEEEQ